MGEMMRLAAEAERRLGGDADKMRAFADRLEFEAQGRSMFVRINTGFLVGSIRSRAAALSTGARG